jgi:protein-disulfide isomerase
MATANQGMSYELSQHIHLPRIQEDFISGVSSGVNGTPTFYINAVRYDGEWDLASVGAALASGANGGQ